jgi:hypothetical protein
VNTPHPDSPEKVAPALSVAGQRRQNAWWMCFSCVDPPASDQKAGEGIYCNICGKEVLLGASISPTVLRRHVHSCNRAVYNLVAASIDKAATKGKTTSIRSPLKKFTVRKVTPTQTRKQLLTATTLALVSMGVPLSAVMNKRFRCMLLKFSNAGAQAPKDGFGFESVKMEVSALVRIVKEKILSRLRGKIIHGTTDHWTSRDNRAHPLFVVLTDVKYGFILI